MKTELAVIGGFLGAGKTTSILEISKILISEGKRVGIVTNDQGSSLVDTNFLKKSGLSVLEVTGGCFCCNFEEFSKKVDELSENMMPDIILAEPVGSCTDLVATIFKPLKLKYTKKFSLSPLSVIADPKRIRKLMLEESNFPSEINYLFKKQLEEADIIVLNKIDTLPKGEADFMVSFLKQNFRGANVITVSAKDNRGIEEWISMVSGSPAPEKPSLSIDYITYGSAEGYLGWLNSTALLCSNEPHDANVLIDDFLGLAKDELKSKGLEIAHLKVYEISKEGFAKASITDTSDEINFDKRMHDKVIAATLIVNARVSSPPDILDKVISDALDYACRKYNVSINSMETRSFKPSQPNPRYRIR